MMESIFKHLASDFLSISVMVMLTMLLTAILAPQWKVAALRQRKWLIGSGVIWVLALMIGALGIQVVSVYNARSYQDRLLLYGRLCAQVLSRVEHEQIANDAPEGDERLERQIKLVEEWQKIFPYMACIYTVRQTDDEKYIFILSPDNDLNRNGIFGEADFFESRYPVGEVYELSAAAHKQLDETYTGKEIFNPQPISDKWGMWVTLSLPIYTNDGGVDAVLVGEMWYNDWLAMQRSFIVGPRIITYFSWILLLTLLWFLLCRREMVSSLRARNQELAKSIEAVRIAQQAATEAATTKSSFVANMSHEIRTPITAILGYAEIILTDFAEGQEKLRGEQSGRMHESIATIRNNTEHVLQIINDIFDFTKIAADQVKLQTAVVPVVPLLKEVTTLYTPRAKEKNVRIIYNNLTPFPELVVTDRTRLKQVLLNLVGNAVKFTLKGEITLTVSWYGDIDGDTDNSSSSTISTPSTKEVIRKGTFQIEVRDTGIGMNADTMSRLFQPFQQADEVGERQMGGTGLGLTISRELMRRLGGDLTAVSEEGYGSTFTLTLPQNLANNVEWLSSVTPTQAAKSASDSSTAAPVVTHPLKGKSILIVEDSLDSQRLFKLIVSKAGASAATANHGEDGFIQAMSAWNTGEPFDLIIMDMQMPVMDGYTAVQYLRREGYKLPIVALTAHALPEERDRCISSGCDDYSTKPIMQAALIKYVLKNLAEKAQSN